MFISTDFRQFMGEWVGGQEPRKWTGSGTNDHHTGLSSLSLREDFTIKMADFILSITLSYMPFT